MKKSLSLLLAAVILLLCGCGPHENEFVTVYLSGMGQGHSEVTVLHNIEERDALIAAFPRNKLAREALSEYDEKFFEERIVFVLPIFLANATDSYVVEKVYQDNGITTFLLVEELNSAADLHVVGSMTILVEMDKSWDCKPENITIEKQE